MQQISSEELVLTHALLHQPSQFNNRYSDAADRHLRRTLFRSLARNRADYLRLFFPNGPPSDESEEWNLRIAQGATEGAEYTAAAKGTACGHIFKSGESTYQCKTCAADDTCVLCARCFEASDHEDHIVYISVSPGNSGCCDCGDSEAWRREVKCTIHSPDCAHQAEEKRSGKAKMDRFGESLPSDLLESIRMTIARAADYLCDVFSCSPEQLRLPKSPETIQKNERLSRLSGAYGQEPLEEETEYALVLWNDEKHTVFDVQNQVARACRRTKSWGYDKAMEVNDIGRSIVHHSKSITELLEMAEIIEHLKLTVTIRSSRDTFREQMCATIISWIADISGCAVGGDGSLLRNVVCEEFLNPWRAGSHASNKDIGQDGIDDHEIEDNERWRRQYRAFFNMPLQDGGTIMLSVTDLEEVDDEDNDNDEDYDMDLEDEEMGMSMGDIRAAAQMAANSHVSDADMDVEHLDDDENGPAEVLEATIAGYPPPPPPPAPGQPPRILTPTESEDGDAEHALRSATRAPYENIPKTPKVRSSVRRPMRPSKHWLEKPEGFKTARPSEPCEDLWQRVRLDWLILYDLRLWKILRINLRHLYITTVITIPHFKRILGLRFAGLYTTLAQLYLIADREPDHSIINLSVQMLTTPSITHEVVERGNFLANLTAILYTFLTTRQVGFPEDVDPRGKLEFEAGAVANRRMFHFFLDLRWLYHSEFILHRMRTEPRYLLQFLDLIKLLQGVCPNVRAIGEHIEYESDTWISASPIVKEINKLCKQVAISFEPKPDANDGDVHLQRAIRTVAQVTMINSFGYERKRFQSAELKDDLAWHAVGPFIKGGKTYSVPKHVVQTEPMSFHHPLHYYLSWLLENARSMSRESVRMLLHFTPDDLKDPWNAVKGPSAPAELTSDELLSSIFEHPLRVCVWLAQMKAAMWVRNGITLRHQAHTYRSVQYRDVAYQRDILMLQAGFVLCGSDSELPGERFLAQIIDRFQLTWWIRGDFTIIPGFEEGQQIDVIEDFFHLLVIILSERGNLVPPDAENEQHQDRILQHEIAHTLCFKPLSFSDLVARITEKVSESDEFDRVLASMTTYRPPEGLNDTGTFELKPEFIELIDPYYPYYSRNYREEAEQIYKKYMAKKTGSTVDDVVYEPKLLPISSGLFKDLSAFTRTPLFRRVISAALDFAKTAHIFMQKVPSTRIETFLHMVLHLVQIATNEDQSYISGTGFVENAISEADITHLPNNRTTIAQLLVEVSSMNKYASCKAAITHILRKFQQRRPHNLDLADVLTDRTQSDSPASLAAEDKERKKQEALARQARVMARMKEQQNSFLQNQGLLDIDDEFDDLDDISTTKESAGTEHKKIWNYPTGTCIWCQEETDEERLYGTFAFLGQSKILRHTPADKDFAKEVLDTPESLDRSADSIRPFGVAGQNKRMVPRLGCDGSVVQYEKRGLSKGFPHNCDGGQGAVATSCGHIMHFSCFELYLAHSFRRHTQQIARNHPENMELKEFVCPLCKALGNTFVPIIWKSKECSHDYELHTAQPFADWLLHIDDVGGIDMSLSDATPNTTPKQQQMLASYTRRSLQYASEVCVPPIVSSMNELTLESPPPPSSSSSSSYQLQSRLAAGRLTRILFRRNRSEGSQGSIHTGGLSPPADGASRSTELDRAYVRLKDTVRANSLEIKDQPQWLGLNPVGPLCRALGMSISAFEIAHRGTTNDPSARSLLSNLSEQNSTTLRVLSETIQSYLAVETLRPSHHGPSGREVVKKQELLRVQLFGVEIEAAGSDSVEGSVAPFLADDAFLFFVDWLCLNTPTAAEALNILQLCYWAELAKSLIVYENEPQIHEAAGMLTGGYDSSKITPQFIDAIRTLRTLATPELAFRSSDAKYDEKYFGILLKTSEVQGLVFLRKSIVAMHIYYGLDFACPHDIDARSAELERLTALLHLPGPKDMFTLYTSQNVSGERLRAITRRWIRASIAYAASRPPLYPGARDEHARISIALMHPAIFELVGLPRTYDALTEEAIRRRCPTTGKEVTDPAICLLCGAIFCSQSVCCSNPPGERNTRRGGCQQHMEHHGLRVGLFLNVRKCMVLLLHGTGHGSWTAAPYLDRHGEPDGGLRRRHQLFLDQRRYDRLLREVWLHHQIPTVVARKLEADINPGGWDTL